MSVISDFHVKILDVLDLEFVACETVGAEPAEAAEEDEDAEHSEQSEDGTHKDQRHDSDSDNAGQPRRERWWGCFDSSWDAIVVVAVAHGNLHGYEVVGFVAGVEECEDV